MRSTTYGSTRRNPSLEDDLVLFGGLGLLVFIGLGIYKGSQALPNLEQGARSALDNTGQATGQAFSNLGTGAHDAVTGAGTAVGGFLSAVVAFKPTVSQTKLATQWRQAAAANAGGSDPNDWSAFRAFAQQVSHFDPGATPWAGWPHAFGGTVFFVGSQQYE